MDCDLNDFNELMHHLCETGAAECVIDDDRGEWIVRIDGKIYVLVVPE